MSDGARTEGAEERTPPHGDALIPDDQRERRGRGTPPIARIDGIEEVPSSGADEPERVAFSDPLPTRSHSLDPSVTDGQESRDQAPPSPDWLEPESGRG